MALSEVRPIFGIHETSFYYRSNGKPYGTLKVLAGSTFGMTGELVKLEGGSFNFAWGVEDGRQTAEVTLKSREYPPFLYTLFLGKAPTEVTADTTGTITTPENSSGSSVIANTGIGGITVTSDASDDLKFTKYIIEAITADTVTLYGLSDQDFHRGTDKEFVDDTLELLSADLSIVASSATAVSGFGLDINAGSGTIALTVGDTATFIVSPPSTRSFSVKIGNPTDRTPEFGLYMAAETLSNGRMVSIDAFRCKASGMPIAMEEKAFSEAEIKAEVFHDSSENGICEIRDINPS